MGVIYTEVVSCSQVTRNSALSVRARAYTPVNTGVSFPLFALRLSPRRLLYAYTVRAKKYRHTFRFLFGRCLYVRKIVST